MLHSCDRRPSIGRRDHAVIVLMLRLGLRASEVAALRMDDLDWRSGTVTVRGKRARVDQLPFAGRCRGSDHRLSAARPTTHYGAGGIRQDDATSRRLGRPRGVAHSPLRERPRRADTVRRPSVCGTRGLSVLDLEVALYLRVCRVLTSVRHVGHVAVLDRRLMVAACCVP